MTEPLFACTKCHSRHPFEELSQAEQFCKNCRSNYPVTKCTYCRAEFQLIKGTATTVCKKCAHNSKLYGEPSICEYCNIAAAFTGKHCHRCTYSELKYGSPVPCDQCKLTCAFNKDEESRKKVDCKVLCWLCTLAYKRVLAKTRRRHDDQSKADKSAQRNPSSEPAQAMEAGENSVKNASSSSENKEKSSHSRHRHHHHHKNRSSHRHRTKQKAEEQGTPSKRIKVDNPISVEASPTSVMKVSTPTLSSGLRSTSSLTTSTSTMSERSFLEMGSADHMIAITHLREQLEATKKIVEAKDKIIMDKDRKITEIMAQQYEAEKDVRTKLNNLQKEWEERQEVLLSKNRDLQKQIKALSAKGKKVGGTNSPML